MGSPAFPASAGEIFNVSRPGLAGSQRFPLIVRARTEKTGGAVEKKYTHTRAEKSRAHRGKPGIFVLSETANVEAMVFQRLDMIISFDIRT